MDLSISGHHHPGCEDKSDGGILFVNAPGLCEAPFPYLVVTIDGEEINTCRHELAMPAELQLVDNHVHTQLAYCAEDVTIERCIQLAGDFGLNDRTERCAATRQTARVNTVVSWLARNGVIG